MKIEALYNIFKNHRIISTDTRKISHGDLYFALKGDNFNGNRFAQEALEKGAAYAIIDEEDFNISDRYILVDNVLETIQRLANYHRKQFDIPIIGITGTNGKTTTKEFINVLLRKNYKTTFTKGNLNNHIGVPLTLLSMADDSEMAIIEMGANHIGEIDFLCKISEPNYGIITNIGTAHIEGFGSLEGVQQTKNELYQFIQSVNGEIFVNSDDPILMSLSNQINRHTYGKSHADCSGKLLSSTPSVQLEWKNESIISNLYGSYNFENIMAAICIANYFEVSSTNIKIAIEEYQSTNNRSQIIKIDTNVIFLDAYNANPTSMNAAINTFSENESNNRLMILGDMLELGNISNKTHQEIVNKVEKLNINTLFIGNEFNAIENKYDFTYLENVEKAIDWLKHSGLIDYQILIKGSRGIHLEGIVTYLENKGN